MFSEATVFTAIFAGIISFLSPCVLPMVPFYLAYLGGSSVEQFSEEKGLSREAHIRVVISSCLFVLGFSVVFVTFFAAVETVAEVMRPIFGDAYKERLAQVGGAIIIVFGMHFLGVFKIPLLYREARFDMAKKPAGYIGAFVMGLAFAFGWTPCIGPILALIIGTADNVYLLIIYSLGLGIPFVLAAVAIGPFMRFLKRFRKYLGSVEKVMGGFLVIAGILIITGTLQGFGTWIIDTFPILGKLG